MSVRIAALALGLGASTACVTAGRVEREIEAANYCETVDECVDVGSQCPFGCNILVNEDEADRIGRLLDRHVSNCMYDCALMTGVECDAGVCEGIYE